MSDNMNVPFTCQSQKAFRLVFLWVVEGNLIKVMCSYDKFYDHLVRYLDYDVVECPSGRCASFMTLTVQVQFHFQLESLHFS